jgi:hypothetical protein
MDDVSRPFIPMQQIHGTGGTKRFARLVTVLTLLWRAIVLFGFVQSFVLSGTPIGPGWQRDQFYWAVVVSLALEALRWRLVQPRDDAAARDVLAAWRNAQLVLHVAAFVAFMRLEAVNKSRAEGNLACMLIVVADAAQLPTLRRVLA